MIRNFFWKRQGNRRAWAKVRWEQVCSSTEFGGVGLSNLEIINVSLLSKWWWGLASREDSLWRQVVAKIYSIEDGEGKLNFDFPNPSTTWRNIVNSINNGTDMADCIKAAVDFKLGNGQTFSFWHDKWCGQRTLQQLFPRLYLLSESKSATINEMGEWDGSTWKWILSWRRAPLSREQTSIDRLINHVAQYSLRRTDIDQLTWEGKASNFSVKNCRLRIEKCVYRNHDPDFPNFWKFPGWSKKKFVVWLACLGRLPSKDILSVRGILTGEDTNCSRCGSPSESSDHCVLDCRLAWATWSKLCNSWGVSWVQPRTLKELLQQWEGLAIQKKALPIWYFLCFEILWAIWLDRNNSTFRRESRTPADVFSEAIIQGCWWAKYNIKGFHASGASLLATDFWCNILA